MKRALIGLAAGAVLLALNSEPHAAPAVRPAAGDCAAMSQAYGAEKLWWGRFSGGRHARMSFGDRGVESRTAELCFVQRSSCEAWLYRMRSDWQYMPRWSECLPGYRN